MDFMGSLKAEGPSTTDEGGRDNDVDEKMREGHLNSDLGDLGEEGDGVTLGGTFRFVWTESRGFDDLRGEGNRRTFWWNVPLISSVLKSTS